MVRLRSAGLSAGYRRSLREAGEWLLRFVAQKGKVLKKSAPVNVIDKWLERAVEWAHRDGERLYFITLGIICLQRSWNLSGPLLRGTWSAIRGWRSLQPSRSRLPLTRFRLECLVVMGMTQGWKCETLHRKEWWGMALACWLGFVCLLRPMEILALRKGDISLPEAGSEEGEVGAIVIIRRPKTRRFWKEQFVLCQEVALVRWLHWWTAGLSNSRQLFSFSRYIFAKRFSECLTLMGLAQTGYTLGSLRAGGATHLFRVERNLGQLQYHGRWKSSASLQHYLHEAMSVIATREESEDVRHTLNLLHDRFILMSNPPKRSLSSLLSSSF